ncbi:hypothetical protein COY27_07020, partial [Candidatus Woesearchaeota archaeon CG_4_10_14_0_2_um_filter_33_13]
YLPQNIAPTLGVTGNNVVQEGEQLVLNVVVADETATFAQVEVKEKVCFLFICGYVNAPLGYQLIETDVNDGQFTWTPDFSYVQHPDTQRDLFLSFSVSDGEFTTRVNVPISVIDVNQLPEFAVETNEPFEENKNVEIIATATDADSEDTLTLDHSGLPNWTVADVNGNVITITGVPTCDDAGIYELTLSVTDGIDTTTEVITINLADVCDVPCVDTDSDGVCDVDEVAGCTDATALNYNALATDDDGSCTYACVDTDNDGVCDVDEVAGCTNPNAFNYNSLATEDDGTCTLKISGCTDVTALNYEPNANIGDGSCVYAHDDAKIMSVRLSSEILSAGDQLVMYVTLSDKGNTDFNDLTVTAIQPDWGIKASSTEFNLYPGQEKVRTLVLPVPYFAQPGEYLIKLTLSNDYYHESTYRLVSIY